MKIFLKYTKKTKLTILILSIFVASFDGVILSTIVSYAGKFSNKVSLKSILSFGIVSITAWCVVYLAQYIMTVCTSSVIKDLNIKLKRRYIWKKYSDTGEVKDSAQAISRLTNDFKLIESQYFLPIISMISNVMLCFVSLIYMIHFNAMLATIFIFFSFIPMFAPKFFSKRLSMLAKDWSAKNALFVQKSKDAFQGMEVLKTYKTSHYIMEQIRTHLEKVEVANYKLNKGKALANFIASVFSGVSFIFPFVIGCLLIKYNRGFDVSTLFAIFLLNDRVVSPLQTIIIAFNEINSTRDIRKKIFVEDSITFTSDGYKKFQRVKNCNIAMLKLKLKYLLTNGTNINIDLKLVSPIKILIFGDSGSGKTTVLNLIQQKITPIEGNIRAKNKDGEEVSLNGNIAYISQLPYIFNASLKDNVTLFRDDFSEGEIEHVLKQVDLYHELGDVDSLDYECGPHGNKLSGGQRQRIEIARALIFKKSLYLVDEVTANLDKVNSGKIRDILFSLNAPVIEVAHHFNLDDKRYTGCYKLVHGELIPVNKKSR